MSDYDDDDEDVGAMGGGGGAMAGLNENEELSLPKSTIAKLISEYIAKSPEAVSIHPTPETRDLLSLLCLEFVLLLSSECTEVCEKEGKKTISGDHVVTALKGLGFEEYGEETQVVLEKHTDITKQERVKKRTKKKEKGGGLSTEELEKIQAELFKKSREKMDAAAAASAGGGGAAGA